MSGALIKTGFLASAAYNLLVKTARLDRRTSNWGKAYDLFSKIFSGPVKTTIHGKPAVVNFGYRYPFLMRVHPRFNHPIAELAHLTHKAKGSPITVIDVGAAIGDTALLVLANCGEAINHCYCIEGDPEFIKYLEQNASAFGNVTAIGAMLSSGKGAAPSLVRIHTSTASAQGEAKVDAVPLDEIVEKRLKSPPDMLKTDVDGFDGRVLAGARETLRRHKPSVLFEWHPILCRATNNSWTEHFEVLAECGYTRFVWWDKFGGFSHFTEGYEPAEVNRMANFCIGSKSHDDWHFDVAALHSESAIDDAALADLRFAAKMPSPY